MNETIAKTLRVLQRAASEHESVVVAYSDGKDARVTMDLCLRSFRRVSAFYMYFIPGLQCVEPLLKAAEERFSHSPAFEGPIRQYPHWVLRKALAGGAYCRAMGDDGLPPWKLDDVYALAAKDAGATLVATGAKATDSTWRRRMMGTWGKKANILYPIGDWNKFQVLGYLKTRGIPIPVSSGKSATGIDLSTPSLLWLHDTYPEDFERLCEVFPFARAVVKRREFFGDEQAA
jgi:phosphoadenosine phosphosulfate reductase